MPNIQELIGKHVDLSISCIDRIYVNGYVPTLQTPGQLCYFLREHLGNPIPSPALFGPIRQRFLEAIRHFAERRAIPVVRFQRGRRKDDLVQDYRQEFRSREGVVLIGVAQERAWSFKASKRRTRGGSVSFDFSRQSVAVNHYYFYVQDPDWGPAFLKIGSYVPFPVKLCLNGHEWAKQQLRRERIRFEALDNGFLSCRHPDRLRQICDSLGPEQVQAFFDRWSARLPWPLTDRDRSAGYHHRLSLWQIEVSLTQVFQRPVQGRHFFEEVIRENLDLGRPDRVALVFPRQLRRNTPPPRRGYRTRVITEGVNPSLHIDYKHSHVKQYFKENRALRTETTINEPLDFHVNKGLRNLPYLRELGDRINQRLLTTQRISHHCVLTQDALDRLQRPTVEDGQPAPGLRFGDPRVMALCHALCGFAHLQAGFRNRDLRSRVADLLGSQYSPGQMTYDLRRFRRKGLIVRIQGTHRYVLTTYGLKVALFYSKLYLRILRPEWQALLDTEPSVPSPLRTAFRRLDAAIQRISDQARLEPAA